MEKLSKIIVSKEYKKIKIMQFGEGNFLRAFVDWFIQKMNDSKVYDGHVVVVQPLEFGRVNDLKEQDGLYTLYLQGLDQGKVIRTHEVIDVLDDFINPYTDYEKFLSYGRSEDLEVVISNTTEAGIVLDKNDLDFTKTPKSFPSKVLALLKTRYDHFNHDINKGLSFICCELIDNNADELKKVLNELAVLKGYDEEFISWLNNANHFSSTLVDRIVPGYPRDEINEITEELGYIDNSIVKGEIFHLWCLKEEKEVQRVFPVDKIGLNARYVPSIKPYKQRKVSILNGCHTCIVPVSYLYGINRVRESIEDPYVGKFAKNFIFDEVIPTIPLPKEDMEDFANSVLERYLNPFVKHELMSIALNSISKYRERVLPTVKKYEAEFKKLPTHALFSLASLIEFYRGKRGEEDIALKDNPEYLSFFKELYSKDLKAEEIVHEVLSNKSLWGEDLTQINEFETTVAKYYKDIHENGMKKALENFQGNL